MNRAVWRSTVSNNLFGLSMLDVLTTKHTYRETR